MKKLVILLIVTMVFVGLMVGSAGAEVIYLEKFQGDGSTGINGTTPTIGVGPWECKADFVQTDVMSAFDAFAQGGVRIGKD